MKGKILFVANIHKHFRAFHIPYIQYLQDQGYEVHVAANDGETRVDEADKQFDICIDRNPFSLANIKAMRVLKNIIKSEDYSLIHCHTAMGSVVARLAAKSFRKKGLKVLYTAHGFHFYKGSPKKFWWLYYPMEKYLSRYTDGIITINREDYDLVKNRNFKNEYSFLTSGVGINTTRFDKISETFEELRIKNNYKTTDFLLLYIAEFIERKNHDFLIDSVIKLKDLIDSVIKLKEKTPNIKLLLAGRGRNMEAFKNLVKEKQLESFIHILGFRTDIGEIIKMSDIGVSVSRQEGLPMNIAKELYMGKPVVATKIRGHIDLIEHGENGFLFEKGNQQEFLNYVVLLKQNKDKYMTMSQSAKIKSQDFLLKNCLKEMANIYHQFLPQ